MNSGARRVQRVYTGNAVLFVDLRAALMTSRSPAIIRVIIERQNEQSSRQRSKDLGKRKEALLDGRGRHIFYSTTCARMRACADAFGRSSVFSSCSGLAREFPGKRRRSESPCFESNSSFGRRHAARSVRGHFLPVQCGAGTVGVV